MRRPSRRTVLGAGLGLLGAAHAPLDSLARTSATEAAPDDQPGRTRNTRFAVDLDLWWTARPLAERVRLAAGLGFPAVEIDGVRGKDLAALEAACAETGVELARIEAWDARRSLADPAHHEAFVKEVGEACGIAARLGAPCVSIVAGDARENLPAGKRLVPVIEALRRIADLAATKDVVVALEPLNARVDHPGSAVTCSTPAVEVCREVASTHVKVCWNFYHMQVSEGDLTGRLRDGFDQLGYARIADHPGRHEPGTGEIAYPRVLRALAELGYRGAVGLDVRPFRGELEAARAVARADRW